MSSLRKVAALLILAGIILVLVVPALVDGAKTSVSSLALGTDDAFATSGLEPRENQIGGGALRWTRPHASFRFDGLGPGSVDLEIEARDHRTEVVFTANGAVVGRLAPGAPHLTARIRLGGPTLDIGLSTEGFQAGDRRLGTQVVSILATPVQSGASREGREVPARLRRALAVVLVISLATQLLCGASVALAFLSPGILLLLVLPAGLWRSDWLIQCSACLVLALAASAVISMRSRGTAASQMGLQTALFLAVIVHGVLPPSPLIVQGDVQLHGNKLGAVAQGDLYPTSRTDHKPPFEIPYGFSFYALLKPWAADAVTNVRVVRLGAAFFSILSVSGLALLLGRTSAGLAAASVTLWTFTPVNLRTMGYGNLSNVFAQAIFLLFLAASGLLPKGVARSSILTLLVALSATAHLSSFIVLLTMTVVAFAVRQDRHEPSFRALIAGTALATAYYSTFLPMILRQVPRLLEERGGSAGVFDPWRLPSQIVSGAGWPLLALLLLSLATTPIRAILPLSRSLVLTGVVLAAAALFSPVEVRYLLALLPLLALTASSVFDADEWGSFPRQRLSSVVDLPGLRLLESRFVSRPMAALLLVGAVIQGMRVLFEFVPLMSG